MRILKSSLLLALAMLFLTCTQAGKPSAFFQPAGFDTDSRINSLRRQMGYMQSKLGLTINDFEFATPKDKKLIATFKAELDGRLVPELSGIYHIPPTGSSQSDQGLLSVCFFYPQYQTQTPQTPTWELFFSSSGGSHTWSFTSPFLLPATESRGSSGSTGGFSRLEDELEHEVWELQISPVEANKSARSTFTYTLTIRLAKIGEGEDLQEIRREEFK